MTSPADSSNTNTNDSINDAIAGPNVTSERRCLRKKIREVCTSDDDLNAFALDYFPQIYRQFTNGMTREAKHNLLLADEYQLADIARALDQLIALDKLTSSSPPVHPSTLRPRRGQQEGCIILDTDFNEFNKHKAVNIASLINDLHQQGYQVVLRDCKAGSVIVTVRGSWQNMMRLINASKEGRLQVLAGYRVQEIHLVAMTKHESIAQFVRQEWQANLIKFYLIVGWWINTIVKLSTMFQLPKWAVAMVITLLFAGTAWATGITLHAVIRKIIQSSPAPIEKTHLKDLDRNSREISPSTPPIAIHTDLSKDANIPDLGNGNGNGNGNGKEKTNENGIGRKELTINTPNKLGPPGILISKIEYIRCQNTGHCPRENHHYEFLAFVRFQGAKSYCQWVGARLPTKHELTRYGGQREWTSQDTNSERISKFFWCIK